jgi:hypothetical protein
MELPTSKPRIIPEKGDGCDFGNMSTENVDWARRKVVGVYKTGFLFCDHAHIYVVRQATMVKFIDRKSASAENEDLQTPRFTPFYSGSVY